MIVVETKLLVMIGIDRVMINDLACRHMLKLRYQPGEGEHSMGHHGPELPRRLREPLPAAEDGDRRLGGM